LEVISDNGLQFLVFDDFPVLDVVVEPCAVVYREDIFEDSDVQMDTPLGFQMKI
tara:strand:+ start:429 stop:590 length:162 start_codon:yes stop_codon:yes gene_type:complete